MTVLLYFLNVACSAGQSTLSKHYASKGGNVNIFNIREFISDIHGYVRVISVRYGHSLPVNACNGMTVVQE